MYALWVSRSSSMWKMVRACDWRETAAQIGPSPPRCSSRPGGYDLKSPERPPLGGTRNLVLVVASFVIYAFAVFASFLLTWYFLCAIQAAVAVPLFVLLVTNWPGPSPSGPTGTYCPIPV
ncbi:MAG: hypothetical protein JRN59_08320 [Nitrososphaerota archaeon]|nr:hypothetical protein [Nitrososphaerota archaeon]